MLRKPTRVNNTVTIYKETLPHPLNVAPVTIGAKELAMSKWTLVPKDQQSPDREYSVIGRDMSEVTAEEAKGDWCPGCGSDDYHHVEGCKICNSCGYSPCH